MEPHSIVVISLHTPKERLWGELVDISSSGVTLRGIDLNSFDDFVSQVLHPEGDRMGLPTLFFPCCASNASHWTKPAARFHRSRKCSRKRPAARSRITWRSLRRPLSAAR